MENKEREMGKGENVEKRNEDIISYIPLLQWQPWRKLPNFQLLFSPTSQRPENCEKKEKDGELSEDEKFTLKDEMQKIIDESNKELEAAAETK